MYIGLGDFARRSGPSAPYGLTGKFSHLCARRKVRTNTDSSDEPVDDTVYRAHKIIAYGSAGRQRARG